MDELFKLYRKSRTASAFVKGFKKKFKKASEKMVYKEIEEIYQGFNDIQNKIGIAMSDEKVFGCPRCKEEVSLSDNFCPHCGVGFKPLDDSKKVVNLFKKQKWYKDELVATYDKNSVTIDVSNLSKEIKKNIINKAADEGLIVEPKQGRMLAKEFKISENV